MDQAEGSKKPGGFPPRKLTVEDVIEWQTRMALKSGPPGFSIDLGGPEQIFKDWEVETFEDVGPAGIPGDSLSLREAARDYGADALGNTISDSMKKVILENDKQLQADTRYEIHRRLLKAGKKQQEIDEVATHESSLKEMAGYLYNVEHPKLKLSARVKTFVYTGFRGTDKLTPAYLPPHIDFWELHLQLRELIYAKAEETGKAVTATDDMQFLAAWKYKMSEFGKGTYRFIDTSWTTLESALDYRRMVRMVKKPDAKAPVPILVPVESSQAMMPLILLTRGGIRRLIRRRGPKESRIRVDWPEV